MQRVQKKVIVKSLELTKLQKERVLKNTLSLLREKIGTKWSSKDNKRIPIKKSIKWEELMNLLPEVLDYLHYVNDYEADDYK